MRENIEQIYQYAWKIWRWRWIALGVAAVVCAAGWAFVAQMPDKYESMARVFFDSQSMLKPVLDDIVVDDEDVRERIIQTSRQTLLSRPNMEKVVRDTDLDLETHTPAEKERLLAGLAKQIEVTGTVKDSIYTIRYKNSDPILAKEVVESVLNIFVEDLVGTIRGGSKGAEEFIEKQIKESEVKLRDAEDRLKEFKRANIGLMPTEAGGYFTRMQNATDNLDQSRLVLNEAIQRRQALESQLSDASSIKQKNTDVTVNMLMEKISNMESNRDALMLQFTNRHPDVISVKQKIITLEKQLEDELLNTKESNYVDVENPIYQELTIELGKVEAEVAALGARKREWQRKVSNLKRSVDTVPQVEADLSRLNRDYDVINANYKVLVSRREAAKISIAADESQFRVIDPPFVPLVPAGPGRPILMSLVLLAGLGVGIAFAFLLSQFKPTFDNTNELSNGSGFPVYGNISTVWKESELLNKKSNFIVFSLAVSALFVAYGIVVGIQVFS
ncbi:MAG: chain-length determining protein [Gammaproteobacteria bacterium]|nr:chain-length determining protein [Gammaproteobacteria bacterium]